MPYPVAEAPSRLVAHEAGHVRRLLSMFLSGGGWAMMFAHAFFDESESVDAAIFGVAGYVFRRERYEALELVWGGILRDYGLSHFHMVDCAHGAREFAVLSKAQRVEVQTRLMDELKKHMERGVCVTMDLDLVPQLEMAALHGVRNVDPYTLCAYVALDRVAAWARGLPSAVEVSYFFESGPAGEVKSNRLMNGLFESAVVADRMRYAGHAFVDKRKAVGVQCADILAWQAVKDRKSMLDGRARRRDFQSLLERDHFAVHIDRELGERFLRMLRRQEKAEEQMARAFYGWIGSLERSGSVRLIYSKLNVTTDRPVRSSVVDRH